MTWEHRVSNVARQGFTTRQASFLVNVMLHAGVCVGRQVLHVCQDYVRTSRVRLP